ncbi:unnamed protein product, partial [Meganyctiphanes norvegica]
HSTANAAAAKTVPAKTTITRKIMRVYLACCTLASILVVCLSAPSASVSSRLPMELIMNGVDISLQSKPDVKYPERPNVFKSAVELRKFLNQLNAYYAIAGRPRFGKRSGAIPQYNSLPWQAMTGDYYDY